MAALLCGKLGRSACLSTSGDLLLLQFFDHHLPSGRFACNGLLLSKKSLPNWSPAFSPPGGSRRLFPRFPFAMGSTFCALFDSLPDRNILPPGGSSIHECGRPYDTMSCLFFTALWLQQSQSILMQEIQPAKDIDLTCFKTFPIKATTCLQVRPMSLDWPVDPIARFDQSRPSSSP